MHTIDIKWPLIVYRIIHVILILYTTPFQFLIIENKPNYIIPRKFNIVKLYHFKLHKKKTYLMYRLFVTLKYS